MNSLKGLTALVLFACSPVVAKEIDFTRYLGQHSFQSPKNDIQFIGTLGKGRLIISGDTNTNLTILLNGKNVTVPTQLVGKSIEIPIYLVKKNTMSVNIKSPLSSIVKIRIKQQASIDLNVQARVHFNTNVSNFNAARKFYGKLGFETISGFPDTNTQEMAQAIGIRTPTDYDGSNGEHAGGYLLHGELIGPGGFWGGVIDLIEFSIPRNEEPPYSKMNHLGMASASMYTNDIAADYQYMRSLGVEFLSTPTQKSDGTKFVVFKDLDGTFYELIEEEGENIETETTQITRLGHVNFNVSDLERSNAWYQMFGYEIEREIPTHESKEVANAMGFSDQFKVQGNFLVHKIDASTIKLTQWLDPFDPETAYPIPVNHLGIHRTAYSTTDIESDVAALKEQGVKFVSPITPCCSGEDSSSSIVAFYDPDGTIVELVEQPYLFHLIFNLINWFNKTFLKPS